MEICGAISSIIDDVVEILFRKLLSISKLFEVFDLGTGKAYKITEVVRILEQLFNSKAKIEYVQANFSELSIAIASIRNFHFLEICDLKKGARRSFSKSLIGMKKTERCRFSGRLNKGYSLVLLKVKTIKG